MLLKIAILASVFATLTLLVIYILSRTARIGQTTKWMNKKSYVWLILGFTYSVGLFIFAFSYWGNHGLGDSSGLPIGHGQAIYNGDGAWTYFYPDLEKSHQKQIGSFLVWKDKLFANQPNGGYLAFDLKTSTLTEFASKDDYEKFASSNSLPNSSHFKDFTTHYRGYWSGWRLYLLP